MKSKPKIPQQSVSGKISRPAGMAKPITQTVGFSCKFCSNRCQVLSVVLGGIEAIDSEVPPKFYGGVTIKFSFSISAGDSLITSSGIGLEVVSVADADET